MASWLEMVDYPNKTTFRLTCGVALDTKPRLSSTHLNRSNKTWLYPTYRPTSQWRYLLTKLPKSADSGPAPWPATLLCSGAFIITLLAFTFKLHFTFDNLVLCFHFLCIYWWEIHTFVRTYVHTYVHTYIYTYTQYIHTYIYTYTQYIHVYVRTYIQIWIK